VSYLPSTRILTNGEATMSDKTKLEQVLEHLLADEQDKAKDLIHDFMVEKARDVYESLLDEEEAVEEETVEEAEESEEEAVEEAEESEEEAVEETVGGAESEDLLDEIEQEIDQEESSIEEVEGDDMEMDMEPEMDGEESDEEGEEEIEDRVDDIEDQLDDLRAEFEKLMSDDDEAEEEVEDSEDELEAELGFESEESEDEAIEEATKLQDDKASLVKSKEAQSGGKSPLSSKPKQTFDAGASAKDNVSHGGEESVKGESAKDHTPSDNIGEEPKAAPAPKGDESDGGKSPISG